MPINVTESAIDKIIDLKKKLQMPDGIFRIALRSGGCSGYTYEVSIIENTDDFDKVFSFDKDIAVCIDKKSYIFLNGIEIDYEETLMKSGFVFNSPLQKTKCGCGESISF